MIKIDMRSSKPIYEQLTDNIKSDVIKGYLKPGDEIPSVRKMAMELSVTPNTVAKAYQELDREGIIETIRGKGTYITENISFKANEEKLTTVKKELETQIVELIYMGMNKDEIEEMVKSIYNDVNKEGR